MFDVSVTDNWKRTFPGAHIGLLLVGNVDNSRRPTPLDRRKQEVEAQLREQYAGYNRRDLLELPVLAAYKRYYKAFDKTYHVQLQLESVLHKGKSLPDVSPLVDANFAAELETMLLSAGHDADKLELPVTIDVTDGTEQFFQIDGSEKLLKPNDMMMSDAGGVVCTVLYGQDRRTPISPRTRRALYVAYVPAGIDAATVHHHLDAIKRNVLLFAPDAQVEYQAVFSASQGTG
jgi:DNA/RNA-binding domain of Phe-tRNA-synthetase-like protein